MAKIHTKICEISKSQRTLIYCMGNEADEIFSSFQLSDDNKKKFNVVKEKFDRYFIPKRMTFSSGPNSTSEDKMRVSLWTTS